MLFQTWFAFFAAACLIAISPGSGAVLSMSHGLSYGVRRTSATILGLEIALVLIPCWWRRKRPSIPSSFWVLLI